MKRKKVDWFIVGSIAILSVSLLTVLTKDRKAKVLGDDDHGSGSGRFGRQGQSTATPTATAAPTTVAPTTVAPTTVAPTTVTPVYKATPTDYVTPPPGGDGGSSIQMTQPETQPSAAPQDTTSQTSQPQTMVIPTQAPVVNRILQSIGIPLPTQAVIRKEETAVAAKEVVIKANSVQEILGMLRAGSGTQITPNEKLRLRLAVAAGKVSWVPETETGRLIKLSVDDIARMVTSIEGSSSLLLSADVDGSLVYSVGGGAAAKTGLPIFVDLSSSSLNTETVYGVKPIPITPEQAVETVMSGKELSQLNNQADTSVVSLVEREDSLLAYRIEGFTSWKLFNLIQFTRADIADVSALSGKILPTVRSFNQWLVDLIARKQKV